jgi:hypothetical protein
MIWCCKFKYVDLYSDYLVSAVLDVKLMQPLQIEHASAKWFEVNSSSNHTVVPAHPLSLTRWAIRSTSRRRRRGLFAPARGPRLAAPPSARGLGRFLRYSHSLPTMCCACVVPLGPPRRLAATPVAGTGGGRVPPPGAASGRPVAAGGS